LTLDQYFNIYRNMKKPQALAALAALAQDNRLDVFRLLVEAGPEGVPAGKVASVLRVAPNTLTFHFDRLREAGLVTVKRNGRSMIYAARYDTMNGLLAFLTENCCRGHADECLPTKRDKTERTNTRRSERVT
jgi:DNA-binding transcriptional ArsR family regulator